MKISFIGSGNVANHLASAFHKKLHKMLSIYSTNELTGKSLAKLVDANFCSSPQMIDPLTDILILAVPDDEIHRIAKILSPVLNHEQTILCHTSGTTDLAALQKYYSNAGILYPLQSFSVNKSVDMNQVPFCINGANTNVQMVLKELAKSISAHVVLMDDETRKVLHIAAVFANNFSNYMYVISEALCKDAGLDFALLRPLIQMTTEKIMEFSPYTMQTGPAKRNDLRVIKEHLKFLQDYPEYRTIYKNISKAIENH